MPEVMIDVDRENDEPDWEAKLNDRKIELRVIFSSSRNLADTQLTQSYPSQLRYDQYYRYR